MAYHDLRLSVRGRPVKEKSAKKKSAVKKVVKEKKPKAEKPKEKKKPKEGTSTFYSSYSSAMYPSKFSPFTREHQSCSSRSLPRALLLDTWHTTSISATPIPISLRNSGMAENT